MKKFILSCAIAFCSLQLSAQQVLIAKNATLTFSSSTVMEDIVGTSKTASSALDTKSGEIIFKVSNTSFTFKSKLMQEHFNENYMESEKFPVSSFKGKIQETIDYEKDGSYPVNVSGQLTVHGVTKPYQVKAQLNIKSGVVSATSNFKVRVADHDIKIPKLVFKNIAEVMDVNLNAIYQPKKS